MMYRRRSTSGNLARKTLELSISAPQVVAHRVYRMATAGYPLSQRDRREFTRMGSEKVQAYYQSWTAMWMQFYQLQFEFALAWVTMPLRLMGGSAFAWRPASSHRAATRLLAAGLAPVHSKAVANAKRLSRQSR
jgi:hypothetical protein